MEIKREIKIDGDEVIVDTSFKGERIKLKDYNQRIANLTSDLNRTKYQIATLKNQLMNRKETELPKELKDLRKKLDKIKEFDEIESLAKQIRELEKNEDILEKDLKEFNKIKIGRQNE